MENVKTGNDIGLSRYLTPLSVWALAVGTSVGWGSLVVTGNTYLAKAGPLGSVLGIIIGGLIMLLICNNYSYMATRYPDAGGIYSYTKNVFGYDRAFLVVWFTTMVYISMFWANATSIPLFARYFFGDTFRFGFLYTIFGYDVYFGEVLLTAAAIILITMLCIKSKTAAAHIMTGMVLVFVLGISICFGVAIFKNAGLGGTFSPAFVPDNLPFSQVLHIVFISPWAFIGFENITHSAEEFKFENKKIHNILIISVITTTLLYVFVTLLSVTAYPSEYSSWLEYIRDLGNLSGMKGLPAFYAASYYMGNTGVVILSLSLLSLVFTSLIGNLRALSRLFYVVSKDYILPKRFSVLNEKQIPSRAMLLVAAISMVIPFFGRTAIGWIVDVTTIGSTLIYGFVSAAAYKNAKAMGDKKEKMTGILGTVIMILFAAYLILPDLFTFSILETETYFLLILWSILGFIYFHRIISKDHARRFGKAIIVWIAILSFVVLMALIWTNRIEESAMQNAITSVQNYYEGSADKATLAMEKNAFIEKTIANVHRSDLLSMFVVIGLFAIALGIMLFNHFSMKKWEGKAIEERDRARDAANKDALTGVKSKRAFFDTELEMDDKIEHGEVKQFGIIVGDVNGLKHINDTLGHQAGDKYICDACTMICEHFKHSSVFRIGGDEFVILLEGRDYDKRNAIISDINEKIEKNIGTTNVVISLGVSEFDPAEDEKFHSVFERADKMMYQRKTELKEMGAITRQ